MAIYIDRKFTVRTALDEYFQGTIGETKFREAIRKGQIPHFRVGTKIILRQASLDKWVAEQEELSCPGNMRQLEPALTTRLRKVK
ncbi:MAG: helix-turn-helix domain-containing protein [Bacteroidales bacterium]|nr:helix-turn-helix domain-containing protein [Bacteroidales bacterium]